MLIMEEYEKIVVDKMFATLDEMINEAPAELHFNKETTFLFISLFVIFSISIKSSIFSKKVIAPL